MGAAFPSRGGGGQAGDLPTEMPEYLRGKRRDKDASRGEDERNPAAVVFPGEVGREKRLPKPRGTG